MIDQLSITYMNSAPSRAGRTETLVLRPAGVAWSRRGAARHLTDKSRRKRPLEYPHRHKVRRRGLRPRLDRHGPSPPNSREPRVDSQINRDPGDRLVGLPDNPHRPLTDPGWPAACPRGRPARSHSQARWMLSRQVRAPIWHAICRIPSFTRGFGNGR